MNTLKHTSYFAIRDNKRHVGTVRAGTDNHFILRLMVMCSKHYAEKCTIAFFRVGKLGDKPIEAWVDTESTKHMITIEKSCLY